MRSRLLIAATLAGTVFAALPHASAGGPPVLDGKKIKSITKTVSSGLQDHDQDQASLSSAPRTECAAPRCLRLDFIYKPAKGVKGNVGFQISWSNPASDMDLYVADAKNNDIGHCGGGTNTKETVVLSGSALKSGRKYTLIADFYRSVNDTVKATVTFPTKVQVATTVPATADGAIYPVNCTL